jgi:hypothetical protein
MVNNSTRICIISPLLPRCINSVATMYPLCYHDVQIHFVAPMYWSTKLHRCTDPLCYNDVLIHSVTTMYWSTLLQQCTDPLWCNDVLIHSVTTMFWSTLLQRCTDPLCCHDVRIHSVATMYSIHSVATTYWSTLLPRYTITIWLYKTWVLLKSILRISNGEIYSSFKKYCFIWFYIHV